MKKAVTLVELIVALVIISIIAALAIPKQSSSIEEGYESAFDAIERNMFNNVERIEQKYMQGESLSLGFKALTEKDGALGLGGSEQYRTVVFDAIWHVNSSGLKEYQQGNLLSASITEGTAAVDSQLALGSAHQSSNGCTNVFHALSGVGVGPFSESVVGSGVYGYQGFPDIGFEPHFYEIIGLNGVDFSNDTGTGTSKCTFKTPLALGEKQRVYTYHIVTNTLTRTS